MIKFVLKRIGMGVATIFVVITLTFFLMHQIPGNPFAKEGKMPPEIYENLQEKYGLNKPLSEQYVVYLKNLAQGDFGESMVSKTETVNEMIGRGLPVSGRLGIQAFVVAMFFGVILGSIAALYQNKFPDYIMMIIALIGISVPSFVMGSVFIQFIAKNSSIFPTSGWGTFAETVLPTIALSLMPLASTARLMRSSMLEVLGQDYIKTAKSKGIKKFAVIMNHAIRNAILPIVSQMGTTLSTLLTGSFVIEKLFGIPGIGSFFVTSIYNRDYTLIMGTTVFYAILLVAMLVVVDILYVVIDPRIKLAGGDK
ncbi:ABC transporter permease [Miniphocaeibacter massiliensis]|uniref:ABC transporter permease n=1 Tax=Miniphocaeibacter massiliensis TaxID=2041841 RepID=UPI000C1BA16A|nr:ABC transporter permease [Miniphocaeibacter massiliensis]